MALLVTRTARLADTTGPSVPTIAASTASTSSITITRTVNSTDPSGVAYYETQRAASGSGAWITFDSSSTSPLTAAGLNPGTVYDFRQRAIDTLGNAGSYSSTVSATTATSGEWADTYITNVSSIGSALSTNGRKVGIKVGSNFVGLAQQITAGNGATMDIVPGGSFDAQENAVRLYPPTALVSGQSQYAGWLRNLEIDGGAIGAAANDIAQMNFRVLAYYGPRYYDLAPPAKCWGFQATTSRGSGTGNNRVGVFDYRDALNWTQWKYPFITVTTVGSYVEPEEGGYIDGTEANKLLSIRNAANHAATPWATAGEWICFEDMFDLRRDRGNPNGIHRLRVWTRDGVISGRYLDVPLTWDAGWNFAAQWAYMFEGLGFYFNTAGTAHPDNYIMYSHATFAANMGISELIGPPPGFLL